MNDMMKNIQIKYVVKRGNKTFFKIFTLYEIETGDAIKWITSNNIRIGELTYNLFTGFYDKNYEEIFFNDMCFSKDHKPSLYKVEFIDGAIYLTNDIIKDYPIDINHFYPSNGCMIELVKEKE